MSDIIPCRGCGALLDCQEIEDPEIYTLDNAGLPFVFNCPPGYVCAQGSSLSLQCCDKVLSVDFPNGATDVQRTALSNNLVQQCQVILASCNGGITTEFFYNTPQRCTALCPDGSPFSYTIQAGAVAGKTQSQANQLALQLACNRAKQIRICMGALDRTSCCNGVAFTGKITANRSGLTWSVVSGSLPTGLALAAGPSSTGLITGTPTVVGSSMFTVRASNSGGFMDKLFTIDVLSCGPVTCAQFDAATVAAVNANFGTAWDGKITGTWGSGGGLLFDCPGFSVGGITFLSFYNKHLPLVFGGNPATASPITPDPFVPWTWNNYVPGNVMFDMGAPLNPVLTPC